MSVIYGIYKSVSIQAYLTAICLFNIEICSKKEKYRSAHFSWPTHT